MPWMPVWNKPYGRMFRGLSWLKYPFRFCLRVIRDIDGIFSWLTDTVCRLCFKHQYTLAGQCKKRGVCCHNIGIWMRPELAQSRWFLRWITWWYTFVYNFTSKGMDDSGTMMLFRCNYLKNNQCSIHWRRPFICRQYPIRYYFKKPVMLPGCGYRIVESEPKQSKS